MYYIFIYKGNKYYERNMDTRKMLRSRKKL